MEENKTLKAMLKDLMDFNNQQLNPDPKVRTDNGPWRFASVADVQENNYEMLAEIADMLGVSDIYLDYPGGGDE
jgi:hypothetical protein